MRVKLIGLVDCNSFYCSCEKIFRPDLRNKPVVVLSNNDGAAIAFTKEAKALGFGQMCEAYFKIKDRIRKNKVAVFSSNYAYYDDISKRVMDVLRDFSPHVEVYSVDEAFIHIEGEEGFDFEGLGREIRSEILRRVGMPVGVGISRTKVLAKMANKLSKKHNGVCTLIKEEDIDAALKTFPVRDLWGIGSRSASKLHTFDVTNAYQLKTFPNEKIIQKFFTKTGREIQDELRGINCLSMEEVEDRKHTGNSRSFGYDVTDIKDLREALAQFCTNATKKLRNQKSVCYGLTAFIHTNPFKPGPQYYGHGSVTFSSGTADVMKIIEGAHQVLDDIYRSGYAYKKGGILLNHLVPKGETQIDLFNQDPSDNEALNTVMDQINKRYGPQAIKPGSCGIGQAWKTIHDYKSKHYTTQWDELLEVEL